MSAVTPAPVRKKGAVRPAMDAPRRLNRSITAPVRTAQNNPEMISAPPDCGAGSFLSERGAAR